MRSIVEPDHGTPPSQQAERVTLTIDGIEVTVPAGTFDAFKIEGKGYVRGNGNRFEMNYWVAPAQLRSFIAFDQVQQGRQGKWIDADRSELVSFTQAR